MEKLNNELLSERLINELKELWFMVNISNICCYYY